jgi:hypothetical protein
MQRCGNHERSQQRILLLCLFILSTTSLCAADPAINPTTNPTINPTIAAERQVIFGTFHNHPFWLNLKAPDPQYGKNRFCELVYTQPDEKTLAGTTISDCPFLLIDNTARVVAWNGRDKGSKIIPAAPNGYAITKESAHGEGLDREIQLADMTINGDRAWDLHLAPVHLALTWKSGSTGTIRVIDFFGPRHAEKLTATWTDTNIAIAGTNYTITADKNGQLATLTTADGKTVLEVKSRQ